MNSACGHALIYLKGEVAAGLRWLGGERVNVACPIGYLFSVG